MLDQDFNRELEVARRKKRWRQKEEELRKERSEKTIQQLKPTSLQVLQIILAAYFFVFFSGFLRPMKKNKNVNRLAV